MNVKSAPRFIIISHTPTQPENARISLNTFEQFWSDLRNQNRHKALFYDGGIRDFNDFYWFMTADSNLVYMCYDNELKKAVAVCWMNNFMGKAAGFHFGFLEESAPNELNIARAAVEFILRDGGISALYGVTPKPFKHALNFAKNVGFEQAGILPEVCEMYNINKNKSKYVDGYVTFLTYRMLEERVAENEYVFKF